MKILLPAFLLLFFTIGFSQTKIYEVPKVKFGDWNIRPNGNVVFFPEKSKSIIEISATGEKLFEYDYKHVVKYMINQPADFISSPDSKHLYVLNRYMDTPENGNILSKLEPGKTTEIFSELSKDFDLGDIIDIFSDNENLYIHSSKKENSTTLYSLYSISHMTGKINVIKKDYYSVQKKLNNYDPNGTFIGQNETSVFFCFSKMFTEEDPNFEFNINQINKSTGELVGHEIKLERNNQIPLFFDHKINPYPNHLRVSSRYFSTPVDNNGKSETYFKPSEIGYFNFSNDTIKIIGLLGENSSEKFKIDLKNFYCINYDTKSKIQNTSLSEIKNCTIDGNVKRHASTLGCFRIAQFKNHIYFERTMYTSSMGQKSSFLSGDFSNNKFTNIAFEEVKGDVKNTERYKTIGIDTGKFDIETVDLGSQLTPSIFRLYNKKTLAFYSIK